LNIASIILTTLSVAFSILVYSNPEIHYIWAVVGIFSIQFFIGFTYPNAIAASLAPFTAKSATASALSGGLRMAAGAMVTEVLGILASNSSFTLFETLAVLARLVTF